MIPKNKASKAKERARVGVEVWGLWVGWAGVGEVGHPPPPIGLVQLRHCVTETFVMKGHSSLVKLDVFEKHWRGDIKQLDLYVEFSVFLNPFLRKH